MIGHDKQSTTSSQSVLSSDTEGRREVKCVHCGSQWEGALPGNRTLGWTSSIAAYATRVDRGEMTRVAVGSDSSRTAMLVKDLSSVTLS